MTLSTFKDNNVSYPGQNTGGAGAGTSYALGGTVEPIQPNIQARTQPANQNPNSPFNQSNLATEANLVGNGYTQDDSGFFKDLVFDKTYSNGEGNTIGGGLNFSNLSSLAKGVGSIFQIIQGNKQLGLAREQLALKKEAYMTNRANQKGEYNQALSNIVDIRKSIGGATAAGAESTFADYSIK